MFSRYKKELFSGFSLLESLGKGRCIMKKSVGSWIQSDSSISGTKSCDKPCQTDPRYIVFKIKIQGWNSPVIYPMLFNKNQKYSCSIVKLQKKLYSELADNLLANF